MDRTPRAKVLEIPELTEIESIDAHRTELLDHG